jgi:dipeptidyl aminopeptidase/acylaminoacyl peptidase
MGRRLFLCGLALLAVAAVPSASDGFIGKNGRIAVNLVGGGITTVTPDGNDPRQLNLYGSDANWAPNGGRIVFSEFGGGIRTMRGGKGGDIRRITERGRDTSPAYSPDGHRIVFLRELEIGGALYTVGANGRGLRRVFRTRAETEVDFGLDWSPDGRWIAFSLRRPSGVPTGIRIIRPDGSGLRRLTSGRDSGPTWSPDGQLLAFERRKEGIFTVSRSGEGEQSLTNGPSGSPGSARSPDWSPSGRKILFSFGSSAELYTVKADGSALTLVPNITGESGSWQPRCTASTFGGHLAGTTGRDHLCGSAIRETIDGLASPDVIFAGGGNLPSTRALRLHPDLQAFRETERRRSRTYPAWVATPHRF